MTAMGVELILLDKSEATGQMWGGWSSRTEAAHAVGVGCGGQILVPSRASVGVA